MNENMLRPYVGRPVTLKLWDDSVSGRLLSVGDGVARVRQATAHAVVAHIPLGIVAYAYIEEEDR